MPEKIHRGRNDHARRQPQIGHGDCSEREHDARCREDRDERCCEKQLATEKFSEVTQRKNARTSAAKLHGEGDPAMLCVPQDHG
jgi:hypothetical protein